VGENFVRIYFSSYSVNLNESFIYYVNNSHDDWLWGQEKRISMGN
jgi:hypothetical protein